jgi:hypothetical protein
LPVQLNLLVREDELRSANLFAEDLIRLGFLVRIKSAQGEAFRNLSKTKEFDLESDDESFLDKEGRPNPLRFRSSSAATLPCIRNMIRDLEATDPETESHRDLSEAIARVHQALHLSIFTGSPVKKNYFFDAPLHLPPGTDPEPEKMHLYGYWLDP